MPLMRHRSVVRSVPYRLSILSFSFLFLFILSTLTFAQDSPPRFEAGGNFTSLRFSRQGFFGPGVDGAVNFGRHFALDGSYAWLPTSPNHVMTGLFGAKAGVRTEKFGFFGKVRPGFLSIGNTLRAETITVNSITPLGIISSLRFDRLTEKAVDWGGVVEYYPARHWAMRWDVSDVTVFQEKSPVFTIILNGVPTVGPTIPSRTTQNFHFSTGIHYRF